MVLWHQKDEQNYVNLWHLSGKIMILVLVCREASFCSEASHTIESLWVDLRLPVSLSRLVSILCAIDILVWMTFRQIQTYLWMTSTLILQQSTLSPIRRKQEPAQVIMKEYVPITTEMDQVTSTETHVCFCVWLTQVDIHTFIIHLIDLIYPMNQCH